MLKSFSISFICCNPFPTLEDEVLLRSGGIEERREEVFKAVLVILLVTMSISSLETVASMCSCKGPS